MKKLLYILVATVFAAMFASCQKDEYGFPPTYGKVYMVNSEAYVGDTIVLRVEVQKNGNGAYQGKYTWKIDGKSVENGSQTVLDPFDKTPEFKFVAKEAGTHNASFSAKFNMSIALSDGGIFSNASAQTGKFTIKSRN